MGRRIAFINEKGGSGKTTLAGNIASYLALRGDRVLAIDLDPQGQLGRVLGVDARRARASALALLVDTALGLDPAEVAADHDAPAEAPITESRIDRLEVITAGKELGLAPLLAGNERDPSGRLERRLSNLPGIASYDFVLVDSPPSFGILTLSILRAVNELVIPVPLTSLGLDGCRQLLQSIETVRTRYCHSLEITLVVPTFWRRTRLANTLLEQLHTRFPKQISSAPLALDVKIDEAQAQGRSVFEYAPRSRGARSLATLAEELKARTPTLQEAPA